MPAIRKFLSADHSILFDRIEEGTLRVDIDAGIVDSRSSGEWKPLPIERNDRGRPFVRIYHKGSRRSFGVHIAVWLAACGLESIPDGYDVDHIVADPDDNRISNLRLMRARINRSRHRDELFAAGEF